MRFPSAMGHLKQIRQFRPAFPVRRQVKDQSDRIGPEVAIVTDACESMAKRIRATQNGRMMLDDDAGDASAFPAMPVQVGAEFKVRRTKPKFLDHSESPVENFTRINR